eukprot:m.825352 g.825352  ORF g.825352 m.825352 type:complete len:393 (-) comp23406_c0_seq47:2227-3405(-)
MNTLLVSSAIALFLVFFAVPESSAFSCTSSSDCQLNGACDTTTGACVCDRAWKGSTCGDLAIDSGSTAYGNGVTPNTSCWGGGPPVYDAATQQYHLFATEIAGHCGMSTWQRMSQAVHAVSDNVNGPYKRIGTAIQTQTHNVLYTYSPTDKKHLIYHIFGGNNPESCNPYLTCTNGSTPGANGIQPPKNTSWPPPTCPLAGGPHVHYSDSLSGPWMSAGAIKMAPNMPAYVGSSNPAPLIFPNGTVLMMGRSKDATRVNGTVHVNHNIFLFRAPSWNGTYEWVPSNGVNGSVNVGNGKVLTEDPVLWQGRRGFHVLLHSAPYLSHGWSLDGLNWDWSDDISGPPIVHRGADHERPRVTLDANGDIAALFVSTLVPTFPGDDASRLQVFVPSN